jgi:hypothetical protein
LLGESELELGHVRRVEGRVTPSRPGWALDLTLSGAFGERARRLRADTCNDLAEAAAVAITLAFEAARAAMDVAATIVEAAPDAAPGDASEAPPLEPPASAASSPSIAVAPVRDEATLSSLAGDAGARLRLGAELVLDIIALPVPAVGPSLLAQLRWSDLALGAYGLWLPESDRSLGPGQSAGFALLAGGVRACYRVGQGLLDTQLCAGLEAGRLAASGLGLLGAQKVSDLWLTPHAGLEVSLALSRAVALHVRGDAVVPLFRQEYAVNETQSVHQVAAVGARAATGVLLAF